MGRRVGQRQDGRIQPGQHLVLPAARGQRLDCLRRGLDGQRARGFGQRGLHLLGPAERQPVGRHLLPEALDRGGVQLLAGLRLPGGQAIQEHVTGFQLGQRPGQRRVAGHFGRGLGVPCRGLLSRLADHADCQRGTGRRQPVAPQLAAQRVAQCPDQRLAHRGPRRVGRRVLRHPLAGDVVQPAGDRVHGERPLRAGAQPQPGLVQPQRLGHDDLTAEHQCDRLAVARGQRVPLQVER